MLLDRARSYTLVHIDKIKWFQKWENVLTQKKLRSENRFSVLIPQVSEAVNRDLSIWQSAGLGPKRWALFASFGSWNETRPFQRKSSWNTSEISDNAYCEDRDQQTLGLSFPMMISYLAQVFELMEDFSPFSTSANSTRFWHHEHRDHHDHHNHDDHHDHHDHHDHYDHHEFHDRRPPRPLLSLQLPPPAPLPPLKFSLSLDVIQTSRCKLFK